MYLPILVVNGHVDCANVEGIRLGGLHQAYGHSL